MRTTKTNKKKKINLFIDKKLETARIELAPPACKARILPLNYASFKLKTYKKNTTPTKLKKIIKNQTQKERYKLQKQ